MIEPQLPYGILNRTFYCCVNASIFTRVTILYIQRQQQGKATSSKAYLFGLPWQLVCYCMKRYARLDGFLVWCSNAPLTFLSIMASFLSPKLVIYLNICPWLCHLWGWWAVFPLSKFPFPILHLFSFFRVVFPSNKHTKFKQNKKNPNSEFVIIKTGTKYFKAPAAIS